jgi:hypothetical protein
MKKLLIAAIALGSVLTFSCKKDYQQPHQLFIGATLKNVSWIAQPTTSYIDNNDSLLVQGFHPQGEQNLAFKIKFTGPGTYSLTGTQAYYFTTVGSDAISSQYQLDPTQTSSVTFTSYNIGTNIAEGRFEIHLQKIVGGAAFDNTLSFTSGQFWMQMPAVPGQ